MNKINLNKIFSTSLSLAMAVTSAPMPAGAVGPTGPAAPAFVARLTPPEQFGYVASSFAPHSAERPRMIVISDLHGHVEVQHNIVGILQHVVGQLRQNGSPMANKEVPVFVEGGWEKHLEEPLREVKNADVRSFMNEYFLQKAEINAAQAYSEKVAGQGQVQLIGVESKDAYLANRAQFLKTYPARKELLLALEHEEAAVRVLTKYLASGSFKRLQTMRDDYMAGRIRPETFARALTALAKKNGINNGMVRTLQNISTASQKDLDAAFSEVYRSVIETLSSKKPLSALLHKSFNNEEAIRENLGKIDASMDLLKRLVANQLTPSEVPLALMRMPELIETAEMLLVKSPLKDQATRVVRESLNFYPYAMLRDDTLTANSLKSLESYGADATGILVTGGFHTDAIADNLRRKNIPYMIIHPVITRDLLASEHLNYIKRVGKEHVTPDEMVQDIEALRLRHPIQSQVKASAAVGNMESGKGPQGGQNPQQFGGYINEAVARTNLTSEAKVLEPILAQAQAAVEAVESPSMAEAQAQVQTVVQGKLGEVQFSELNGAIDWTSGVSLGVDGSNAQGLSKAEAAVLGGVLRDVFRLTEQTETNGQGIDAIHIVGTTSDDAALEKLGSEGKVFWKQGDRTRTVVLSKTKMDTIKFLLSQLHNATAQQKAAIQSGLQTLVHEVVHMADEKGVDGQNRSKAEAEANATLKAIIITAYLIGKDAGEGKARDEILTFVNNMMRQLENGKDTAWVVTAWPNLAEMIANALTGGKELDAAAVQQLVDELMVKHPKRTAYEAEQAVRASADAQAGLLHMFSVNGNEDLPGGVPPTVGKGADDKLNQIDSDAGRDAANAAS
jgi:hypothetical protein